MKCLSVPIQFSFEDTFIKALKNIECESDDETYAKAFNELKKLVIEAYEETKQKTKTEEFQNEIKRYNRNDDQ